MGGVCGISAGKQPVNILLLDGTLEPLEEQFRGANGRYRAERNAERELIRQGLGSRPGRDGILAKGALDLAAARIGILRDDQQAGLRVGFKVLTAP